MKHNAMRPVLVLAALFAASAPAFAADASQDGGATMVTPEDLKWGEGPPSLPKGAKLAVLQGDPAKDGLFALRLRFPAGYRIAPHTHPSPYTITILSGTPAVGMGEKVDAKALHPMKVVSFHYLPANTSHYWEMKTATEFQVQGTGPFSMKYINDQDDPEKVAASKK